MARLYLGIDGGQSSTKALLADDTGKIIGRGRGGPCNHAGSAEGRAKFLSAVGDCLRQAYREAGVDSHSVRFASVCLGLSGGSEDKEAYARELIPSGRRHVVPDSTHSQTETLMALKKATVAHTAADPTLRFAKVGVNGKTYKLAFSFNAIALAEAHSGANLLAGIENLMSLSASQFRGLLYAAITTAHPKMTLQDTGNLITFTTLGSLKDALAEAYVLSMPDPVKEDDKPNPPLPDEPAQ